MFKTNDFRVFKDTNYPSQQKMVFMVANSSGSSSEVHSGMMAGQTGVVVSYV